MSNLREELVRMISVFIDRGWSGDIRLAAYKRSCELRGIEFVAGNLESDTGTLLTRASEEFAREFINVKNAISPRG